MADTKASVTITFSASCKTEGASISIEMDEERNKKQSCFRYGEMAYFKVYTLPADMEITVSASDGTIYGLGAFEETVEKQVTFENTDEAETDKPITQLGSVQWYGRDLGQITRTGDKSIRAQSAGLAIAKISHTTSYRSYGISVSARQDASWPVLVLIEEKNG
jgi:hypothetical protein